MNPLGRVLAEMARQARQTALDTLQARALVAAAEGAVAVPNTALVDLAGWQDSVDTDVRNAVLAILLAEIAGRSPAMTELVGITGGDFTVTAARESIMPEVDRHLEIIRRWGEAAGEAVKALVERAIREGWSLERLEEEIRTVAILKEDTAERISEDEHHHVALTVLAVLGMLGSRPDTPLYKQWVTVEDEKVRDSHRAAHGQIVPATAPFVVGDSLAGYPGDPLLPPGERINCFPADTVVDHAVVVGALRSWHDGTMVTVTTRSGRVAGTPNHPMLTGRGWVALQDLQPGDHLVRCGLGENAATRVEPHVEHVPAEIGQVFEALAGTGLFERVPGVAVDFHGDRPDGDVDVVRADRPLRLGAHPSIPQPANDLPLALANMGLGLVPGDGTSVPPLHRVSGAASRRMGSGSAGSPFFGADLSRRHPVGLGTATSSNTLLIEPTGDHVPGDTERLGQCQDGLTGKVSLDEVLDVEVMPFHGWVYTVETTLGWYSANGFVARNCRCFLRWQTIDGEDEVEGFKLGDALDLNEFWHLYGLPLPGGPPGGLTAAAGTVGQFYRRDQARIPKGQHGGGRFADEGGGGDIYRELGAEPGDPAVADGLARVKASVDDVLARVPPDVAEDLVAVHEAFPTAFFDYNLDNITPEAADALATAATEFATQYPHAATALGAIILEPFPDPSVGAAISEGKGIFGLPSLTIESVNDPDFDVADTSDDVPAGRWLVSGDDHVAVIRHELGHLIHVRESARGNSVLNKLRDDVNAGRITVEDADAALEEAGISISTGYWDGGESAGRVEGDEIIYDAEHMAANVSQYALVGGPPEFSAEVWAMAHQDGRYDPTRVPMPYRGTAESMHRGASTPMTTREDLDRLLEPSGPRRAAATVGAFTAGVWSTEPDHGPYIFWLHPPTPEQEAAARARYAAQPLVAAAGHDVSAQPRVPAGSPKGGEWVKTTGPDFVVSEWDEGEALALAADLTAEVAGRSDAAEIEAKIQESRWTHFDGVRAIREDYERGEVRAPGAAIREVIGRLPSQHFSSYRGLDERSDMIPVLLAAKPGQEIDFTAPASASVLPWVAGGYAGYTFDGQGEIATPKVLMRIDSPGTYIGASSGVGMKDMHEIIVPPGRFVVTDIQQTTTTRLGGIDREELARSPWVRGFPVVVVTVARVPEEDRMSAGELWDLHLQDGPRALAAAAGPPPAVYRRFVEDGEFIRLVTGPLVAAGHDVSGQPRVPAGSPEGGQWAGKGGGPLWTPTETLRRLRVVRDLLWHRGVELNSRRTVVRGGEGLGDIATASKRDDVRTPGATIHLDLVGVVAPDTEPDVSAVVWMGDAHHEPKLVSVTSHVEYTGGRKVRRDTPLLVPTDSRRHGVGERFGPLVAAGHWEDQPRVPAGNPNGGEWAETGGTGANAPVVHGATLDEVWDRMGASEAPPHERHPEKYGPLRGYGYGLKVGEVDTRNRVRKGVAEMYDVVALPDGMNITEGVEQIGPVANGSGVRADGAGVPLHEVRGSARPIPYAYRIMDTAEWEQAKQRGYIKSDERMNLGDEGTVFSTGTTGSFYAPPVGRKAVIVRVRTEGTTITGDDDGYLKTHDPVPIDNVDLVSVEMEVVPGSRGIGHRVRVLGQMSAWAPPGWTAFRDVSGQPRHPAGSPQGGQWAPAGGSSGAPHDVDRTLDRLDAGEDMDLALVGLGEVLNRIEELGDDAPNVNLCQVKVPGSSLLCQGNKGIPRAEMPQLSGVPRPGSKAEPLNEKGRVDITDQFYDHLRSKGVDLEDRELRVDVLRSTQNEMSGPLIAAIMRSTDQGTYDPRRQRLVVSNDGYILDGHHRWAAMVGLDSRDGRITETMPVTIVDMPIDDLLVEASRYADDWGIPQLHPKVLKGHFGWVPPTAAFKFRADQPRVPAGSPHGGEWADGEQGTLTFGTPIHHDPDEPLKDGFRRVTTVEELPEIRQTHEVYVPPGWTNTQVSIDPHVDGMRARGRDAKGRSQARYPASHQASASASKYQRIREFEESGAKDRLVDHLRQDRLTDPNAAALQVMRRLGIRPGSEADTKADVRAYGATTLEARHVKFSPDTRKGAVGDKVTLDFIGKKGVRIRVSTADDGTVDTLRAWVEGKGPNEQVFPGATATGTNEYMRTHGAAGFTNKDLRTSLATGLALSIVRRMRKPKTVKAGRAARRKVAEKVSKALGNQPGEALRSYIAPEVWDLAGWPL